MVEKFLDRYQHRSEKELEFIVRSRSTYEPEAVEAAMKLLEEKYNTDTSHARLSVKKPQKDIRALTKFSQKLTLDVYIHTFSNREVTSAVACGLLFVAFTKLFGYYMSEDWIRESYGIIVSICFVGINILNHILYKKEHRKRNLLWGRIVQVSLTTLMILILFAILNLVDQHQTFLLEANNLLGMSIFLVLVVFVTEGIISTLRRFLLLFKWQTW